MAARFSWHLSIPICYRLIYTALYPEFSPVVVGLPFTYIIQTFWLPNPFVPSASWILQLIPLPHRDLAQVSLIMSALILPDVFASCYVPQMFIINFLFYHT